MYFYRAILHIYFEPHIIDSRFFDTFVLFLHHRDLRRILKLGTYRRDLFSRTYGKLLPVPTKTFRYVQNYIEKSGVIFCTLGQRSFYSGSGRRKVGGKSLPL